VAAPSVVYERRRPEETTLYRVVADNLETFYGAVDDGALPITLPKFVKKELEGYLDCGLLCRGFARVRCDGCEETRLVAFSCKGRGFCPSCLGRRMSATAAHLIEDVLPAGVPLRQWVLTFPFAWRRRLGYDAPLLARLTRIFVTTVLGFYRGVGVSTPCGQSGAVVAVQRTSSDLKLNPHLHAVFLDGAYRGVDASGEPRFEALGHLSTSDVSAVLERARDRMTKHLRKKGLLEESAGVAEGEPATAATSDGLASLAASAVTGSSPPAGPEWRRGGLPVAHRPMVFERPLSVALDGFTLHAATRAGGLDTQGREALLKYILRPAIAQERVTSGPEGLVRIALKRAFSDGTVAVDLDPLSLLSRLVAAVPAPRFHTVRYAGVLGSASKLRARIVRASEVVASATPATPPDAPCDDAESPRRPRYRPWAELLKRTFGLDVLCCPGCGARMRLLAMVTEPKSITRYLRSLGEPTDAPARSPPRGPPYWKSRALRRTAVPDHAAE
jgi:hypothetical protein